VTCAYALHRFGCGIDIDFEPLVEGIRGAGDCFIDERRLMGARDMYLLQTEYSWSSVTEQISKVYDWQKGGGLEP
jgi:hypothetical protein